MADSGPVPTAKSGVSKHRKTTCAACRRRKSKCDGGHPRCSTCIAYKDQCHYDKPPSLAYVRSLEEQVEELKKKVVERSLWPLEDVSLDGTKPPSLLAQASHMSLDTNSDSDRAPGKSHFRETDLSVDADGKISYHNSTSAIHDPPMESPSANSFTGSVTADPSPTSNRKASVISIKQPPEEMQRELVANAASLREWEEHVVQNTILKADVPATTASELLKLHFTWISPMFLFVYRPAFIRGMSMAQANGGDSPYYSDALLKVIFAHTARFLNHPVEQHRSLYEPHEIPQSEIGDTVMLAPKVFMNRLSKEARFALAMETMKSSSIPTVQALLQQSARDVAFGKSSQAWLYSGMAFRLAIDLGVHLPTEKFQNHVKALSAEDIEIRRRLFWSCYTWDKAISLYLGRMPNFMPNFSPEVDVPMTFMDNSSEDEPWSPYYGEPTNSATSPVPEYPATPGHILSCFTYLCKLSLILNTLLLEIYSSSPYSASAEGEPAFNRISLKLKMWWTSLPTYLRILPDQIPHLSPPPHIVSMNLLYHTTLILLHRPYVLGVKDFEAPLVRRSLDICTTATKAIHDLLHLLSRTFGFSHITYLNTYSCYIAATIAMLQFEHDSNFDRVDISSEGFGLRFLLEVLQKTTARMPALDRSVDILKRKLKNVLDRRSGKQMATVFDDTQLLTYNMPVGNIPQPVGVTYPNGPVFASPDGQAMMGQVLAQGDPSTAQAQMYMYNLGPNGQPFSNAGYTDELLPAFPGQQFPVGPETGLGPEMIDAETRRELMRTSLNPHLSLDHHHGDWVYTDYFTSQGTM